MRECWSHLIYRDDRAVDALYHDASGTQTTVISPRTVVQISFA